MAKLKKCRDCGHKISKAAQSCPQCGAPQVSQVPKKQISGGMKFLLVLMIPVVVFGISKGFERQEAEAARLAAMSPEQRTTYEKRMSDQRAERKRQEAIAEAKREARKDRTNRESVYIARHRERMRSRLKDPDSAEFRDVFVSYKDAELTQPVVCGELNAKNAFGGFTGYKKFLAGGSLQVSEEDMEWNEFVELWNGVCGTGGYR